MKIVIDARELRSSTGRYIERLLYYLQKINSNHQFVVLLKPGDFDSWTPSGSNFSKLACPHKEFGAGEQIGFLKQLKSIDANLVHFGMVQQPVFYGGPKVTTIHDLTTTKFNNPSKNPIVFKFKQEVYKWLIKKVSRDSRFIITPSNFVKKDLIQFTGVSEEKIFVTYEAADKISDSPQPINELVNKKFLMYVGRPNPHKNLARLIEAFEIVRSNNPDLKLVIAGKKDFLMQKHEQDAQKRDLLGSSVVFTGFVSEGELRWLYENTLAYVFPSLSEGFGLPGLEAMTHGAPVISSNATCLPEIYKDGAHYFNPNDKNDIASKIKDVINNEKLRKELINKGGAIAEKYSWQKMAEQTLNIYEKALS
ncbi:glycosyltransferase family 1 protein [Candidatus Saccharibacteria bacterium CPR2]|nr:glycosyltransferase family 1 protein [Candidatus Saccharibacteria bacterium CPR2]